MEHQREEEFAELRRRAEALLHGCFEKKGALDESSKSLPELIHELEVHQIELEMQNVELLQTEQRLEASEKKYADLYNFAPVGYFTFNAKGTILEANLTGASLLGMDRQALISTPFPAYCTPESADQFYLHVRRVLTTKQPAICELTLKRQGGAPFEAQLESVAAEDVQGACTRCQSALSDITVRKRAELARVQLAAIVESSDDAIIGQDLNGTILTWNRGATELYGYSAEEMIGKPFSILEPPDHSDAIQLILVRIRNGEKIQHFETVRQGKDGRTIHVSLTISPIRDATGRIMGASSIAQDITARKRVETVLHDSEERLRLATEAADLGTWDYDALTGEVKWSDRCKAAFGLPPEATVDYETFIALVHPEDRQRVDETSRQALDPSGNGECKYEYRALWPDGTVRWIASLGQASFENFNGSRHAVRCIGTIADITARKQVEELLRRQGEQLKENDRRKNEFLSMMAHELRNPLAPIRNAVQILRLGAGDEPSVKRQGEMIDRQVGQMARLLDDLLDISRITHGKIKLQRERLDLRAVVERALETSRFFVNAHGHHLHYDPLPEPLCLDGDGARLEQVICNLLNNSIKYTETGGQIWVSLERETSVGDPASVAVLRIRDSGIGMAPELLPCVFELFTQAERSLDRAEGGLGIGLNLVRRLVELHGGTIEAHSAGLGQGSEFVIRLPLLADWAVPPAAKCPDSHAAEPERLVEGDPEHRILLVDDNVDTTNSLGELLEAWGHEVRRVYDGLAALPAALEFRPDLVLLDLGLPGLSGCEVAPLLRAEPALAATTIIALTGYGQEEDRRQALAAGFDDFFTKPVDLERLHGLLRKR